MSDCRTCLHNIYADNPKIVGWVDCGHPITLDKTPKWKPGDPAAVNYRTGDIPVSQLHNLCDCPTFEPKDSPTTPEGK